MAPTLAEYEVAAAREARIREYAQPLLSKVAAQYERGLLTTLEYAGQCYDIANASARVVDGA